MWVNGHAWAKQQATKAGIGWTPSGLLFFEALVADNLDVGRPEQIELVFGRKILPSTPGEGRALRIETVVNDPTDLGVLRRLAHLLELQARARDVNRRLLDQEHVGQGCVLASPAFERIARPSLVDGRRAPALSLNPWIGSWVAACPDAEVPSVVG